MKNRILPLLALMLASCASNVQSEAHSPTLSSPVSSEPPISSASENTGNEVDVFVFMGQSNMAGRGDKEKATVCQKGHGYEFRAVTDPTRLYDIEEPFGVNENNDHINDGTKKSGSLVSAFCEAYYAVRGVPIIGISASQGGTSSDQWQPGKGKVDEAASRLSDCLNYLYSLDDISIAHIEMVWLQGENDAGNAVPYETYKSNLQNIVDVMKDAGVEHCFTIQIGPYMASESQEKHDLYTIFHANQVKMAAEMDDVDLCSIKLSGMPESMMHDKNHFYQEAYNIVGNDAGHNVATYLEEGEMPELIPLLEEEKV